MNFKQSLELVLKAEAGYVNDPTDTGGETIFGISRKNNPESVIWTMLDTWKERGNDAKALTKIARTNPEFMGFVEAIYRGRYWNPCQCDRLPDVLRYPVFSCAVNCGHVIASKFVQRAVNVEADGTIGKKTINATILANKTQLMQSFYNQWETYYDLIVQKRPANKKFINGWKNRIKEVQNDNH